MKKLFLAISLLTALVAGVPGVGSAAETIDYRYEVNPGDAYTWAGKKMTASNQHYFENLDPVGQELMEPYTCNKTRLNYCEVALVKVNNPVPADDVDGKLKKNIQMRIGTFDPVPAPATDFDLVVYASDASGTRKEEVAQSAAGATSGDDPAQFGAEAVDFTVNTTTAEPSRYYLVHIVYFQTVETGYTGEISFK